MTRRVACIDIGTNSVLLLVAQSEPGGGLSRLTDRATITRLGQGVDQHGVLDPQAVERTLACLSGYADVARELEAAIEAVATSAMRDASGARSSSQRSAPWRGGSNTTAS